MTEKQVEEKNANKKKDKRPKVVMDRGDLTKGLDDESEEEENVTKKTKKKK